MPKAQQQVVQVWKHSLGDCDWKCHSFSLRWTWGAANSGKWMRRTCTTSSWKTCPASSRRQRTRVPVWTRERWEHFPADPDDHVDLCRNSKRGGMATHAGVALELGIIRPAEGKSRWGGHEDGEVRLSLVTGSPCRPRWRLSWSGVSAEPGNTR